MRVLSYVLTLCLLCLVGCSSGFDEEKLQTIGPERTLVRLAGSFLTSIAKGEYEEIHSRVVWLEYFDNQPGLSTKADVKRVLAKIRTRWSPQKHPLLGLTLLDVKADETSGKVVLMQPRLPDLGNIVIRYRWIGSGWMVADDNILGSDGVVAELLGES